MQVTDAPRQMISRLGEDHWEGKYERKAFREKKPGAHPMGATSDKRTKRQKEDAVLAGERPTPKPKPSMHHIQMSAGCKKRLGKGGAGMHFVTAERAAD